jgi:hypothetical protein
MTIDHRSPLLQQILHPARWSSGNPEIRRRGFHFHPRANRRLENKAFTNTLSKLATLSLVGQGNGMLNKYLDRHANAMLNVEIGNPIVTHFCRSLAKKSL